MPCKKGIFGVVTIAVCVAINAAADSEGTVFKDLPVQKDQLMQLVTDVCSEFAQFLKPEEQDMKESRCQDNFASQERDMTSNPPKVQIVCQSEEAVIFRMNSTKLPLLVIMAPDDEYGFINYNIFYKIQEIYEVATQPPNNYTMWTTVLNIDGTPSIWRRGPTVPPWKAQDSDQENFSITKDMIYTNGSHIDAVFKWSISGANKPCGKVTVSNSCNKTDDGKILTSYLGPFENQSILVRGLPLDDFCTFVLVSLREHRVYYQTPTCDSFPSCEPLPDFVKNISLEANPARSGLGWDVHVWWEPLNHTPINHNVTIHAGSEQSIVVLGNETEATFRDVAGAGLYYVTIDTNWTTGNGSTSARSSFPKIQASSITTVVGWVWCALLLLSATLVGTAVWWRRQQALTLRHLYFPGPEYKLAKDCGSDADLESVEDGWEIRSERLLLHEVIGEGAFGVVRRGTMTPGRAVAVKMLKEFPTQEEVRSFRAEMELMKSVGAHPHVVSLVGCCSGRRPLIVAEYCSRGDLLSFLRCSWDVMVSKRNVKYYNNNLEGSDYRNDLYKNKLQREQSRLVVNQLYDLQGICDAELTSLDLLSFCRQIAKGMEFLASNRVVHRDLAARNVLVSADRTLKIADFGLSRDVYQENQYKQKGNGKMPVKWMALESLTHRIYTTQSDVWSFGVVVWEVVTVGGAPYPEVPASRLPRLLRAGYRMPKPNNCSKQLYDLMLNCWRARPRERPTFSELHRRLDELLNTACADEYLSLELEADDPPPTPKAQRYIKMILRGNRVWTRGESYERPLKALQSNHYTTPPAPNSKVQVV